MASIVDEFDDSPSVALLDQCTKDQLLLIAEQYELEIADKRLKESVKISLKAGLLKKGILKPAVESSVAAGSMLSFEQQKDLLLLTQKHELQLEEMKQRTELVKLELQNKKLRLIQEGVWPGSADIEDPVNHSGPPSFDITRNLCLLPKFNEKDPDSFFSLFERIADSRQWPEDDQALMLQCVLTGKAQEAYSALSADDCKSYKLVKSAVLKAYELVPEAYRQRFRGWKRGDKQSHVEFVRELTAHFGRWCSSSEVDTFDKLCDLVVLEQFKNSVPNNVATYITEHKAKTPGQAAVLADEYVLIHRGNFSASDSEKVRRESFYQNDGSRPYFRGDPGMRDRLAVVGTCNYCKGNGHWKSDCPHLKSKHKFPNAQIKPAALVRSLSPVAVEQVEHMQQKSMKEYEPFISDGFVSLLGSDERVPVKILRDTGAVDSFVRKSVLPFSSDTDTGDVVLVRGMGMVVFSAPLHNFALVSGLVNGAVEMGVRTELPMDGVDIILGNGLAGVRVWADGPLPNIVIKKMPSQGQPEGMADVAVGYPACAVTRAMTSVRDAQSIVKDEDLETVEVCVILPEQLKSMSRSELATEQKNDSSLKELFDKVLPGGEISSSAYGYFLQGGLLFRKWVPHGEALVGEPIFQFVVPRKFRDLVLQTCHNVAGHPGVRKTYDRVLRYCFWPRLKRDISAYIKTCHTCQLTGKPNQSIKPAPLCPIPVVEQPFEHLIIDCVGPLPHSKRGNNYLLTVMCQVTRYPAAYPLRTITTKSVVKALTQFISVFGIPKIIQSDQGSNFTSHMFAEILQQLQIKHNKASAYHAQSQGALERFHQTLKSLLRSYCTELGGDWEEGLPWLLLAAREVVQESTGFSPNYLVFGHKVRGPMAVLRDGWEIADPPQPLLDYVNGFRQRLFLAGEIAKEKLVKSQHKMKTLYDRRAEPKQFKAGDQVLVLQPIVISPFEAKFSGPYTVVRQVSDLNYIIATPKARKATKLCHVNLLKPFYACHTEEKGDSGDCGVKTSACSSQVVLTSVSPAVSWEEGSTSEVILQGRLKNSESLQKLDCMLAKLDDNKRGELVALIRNYPALFSDVPSRTHLIEHDVDVGDAAPIKQRFYRVSSDKRKHLDQEVRYMLDNNIAEPCSSSWASPCLLVSKPDNTYRPCTDFRKVNNITKPDVFPLPRMEDCIDQVGSATYVSKFDLLKGYWQVPLSKRAQEICAFITPSGLYKYTVMPFGLRNAPATFQRLMNQVVAGLEGCAVYLDDVVTHSDTWSEHIHRIRALFDRLVWAGLTVNLAKCEFAKATVTYLGKVVGQGQVRMLQDKVAAIVQYPPPTTKKELMRFLGMVGYYRSFCRNFSSVVEPLTALLKKDTQFVWTDRCSSAFENVKALLCAEPVLAAPRFDASFSLQVDASNVGAGAVLLQTGDHGVERPVAFFSKKFNRYQLNYSVIEKEALALISALQHFEVYLGSGLTPLVVYTDHNPLTFLRSLQNPNQRLMRWALFLQPYHLDIRHIKGSENVMADALSRSL